MGIPRLMTHEQIAAHLALPLDRPGTPPRTEHPLPAQDARSGLAPTHPPGAPQAPLDAPGAPPRQAPAPGPGSGPRRRFDLRVAATRMHAPSAARQPPPHDPHSSRQDPWRPLATNRSPPE